MYLIKYHAFCADCKSPSANGILKLKQKQVIYIYKQQEFIEPRVSMEVN
jgi:hypothetical protein